jgi:bifunctional non-homologous end joining protein LigD
MKGSKLNGEWVLVRSGKKNEPKQPWFLMKAGEQMAAISAKKDDQSALTGRTMRQIEKDNDAQWVSNRKSSGEPAQGHEEVNQALQKLRSLPSSAPKFVKPPSIKTGKSLPNGNGWIYEVSFEGPRAIAIKKKGKAELLSSAGKSLNKNYPEVVDALKSLPIDSFALDGQIIQPEKDSQEYFLAFDLLNYQDRDITKFNLEDRKRILEFLLSDPPEGILFSSSIEGNPKKITQEAKKRGLHTIAARKKDAAYKDSSRLEITL